MENLYHIALKSDWEQAQILGAYSVSTIGKHLDEDGFIHLSYAHQVKRIADIFYTQQSDVLLLHILPEKLTAPVETERNDEFDDSFPHLYGPLNLDTVSKTQEYSRGQDGTFPPVTGQKA